MVIIRECILNNDKEISDKTYTENDITDKDKVREFGVAADIGTTTVAVGLFRLCDGCCVANYSETNHQTRYGADVMMRIMNAGLGRQNELHDIIIAQIEDIISKMCAQNHIDAREITRMVIVGNTTMCHLFAGKDVSGLAGSPFAVAYEGLYRTDCSDIGFSDSYNAQIYVMPGVAAHVGADAVSVLCEQELYSKEKIQLAIDIGTNAEIILNNKGKLFACSTAAGPAFEGKGVKCGMRAASGAINGAKISRSNGNIILEVIKGNTEKSIEVKGICGSGLVDIIAELARAGILKKDGYLIDRETARENGYCDEICCRLEECEDGNSFVLYDNKSSKVIVTQKDVRSIQLAKAAIRAGVEILLQENKLSMKDVDEVKIAGVFGKFIHPKSAVLIGLYPDVESEKLEFIGNSAGRGAARALLDKNFIKTAEKYAKIVNHTELADKKEFQNKFMNAMEFKSW